MGNKGSPDAKGEESWAGDQEQESYKAWLKAGERGNGEGTRADCSHELVMATEAGGRGVSIPSHLLNGATCTFSLSLSLSLS